MHKDIKKILIDQDVLQRIKELGQEISKIIKGRIYCHMCFKGGCPIYGRPSTKYRYLEMILWQHPAMEMPPNHQGCKNH